ncbi:MAG: type II secretion system protein GspN [Deltaproteobacteria bacterium]|nr:type II secretion system protein GspN [Deltaproteobacteria bacterium]
MKILKIFGYVAFFFFCLALGIYFTFPWTAAADRALQFASEKARQNGTRLEIEARDVKPSFLTGLVAHDLAVKFEAYEHPIVLQRLDARAHFWKMIRGLIGVSASVPIAKGTLDLSVAEDGDEFEVQALAKQIELALVPTLGDATGVPLSGELALDSNVRWSPKDPKKTEGELKIKMTNIETLKGAKIMGVLLPELVLGNGELTLPIEKGKVRFDKQRFGGENLEVVVDGEILLNKKLALSTLALVLSFKPTPALLKKEPLIGAMLGGLSNAKGADGFYSFSVTGPGRAPRFQPRKRA